MGDIRDGVTQGWLGFWDARVKPQGDYSQPRHGNWIHGGYSKTGRSEMRAFRLIVRSLRTKTDCGMLPETPPGWRLYPCVRNQVEPQRDAPARVRQLHRKGSRLATPQRRPCSRS